MDFLWIGPALAVGLSAIGSSIGCGIAGMASHAIMSRIEEGHGKFIALSAAPASQVLYGFVLMFTMKQKLVEGTLSPLSAIGIGLGAGLGIMFAAIYQGKVCASGIQATAKQPSVFGKCFASVGIVESFALFSMAFSLLLYYF